MARKISLSDLSNKSLTQSVLQVSDMLALYYAELARILHLQCGDIGKLSSAKSFLVEKTTAWDQAMLFITSYNLLYDLFNGDGVLMRNWLCRENDTLKGVPLLLIIDDGKLKEVFEHIKKETGKNDEN